MRFFTRSWKVCKGDGNPICRNFNPIFYHQPLARIIALVNYEMSETDEIGNFSHRWNLGRKDMKRLNFYCKLEPR